MQVVLFGLNYTPCPNQVGLATAGTHCFNQGRLYPTEAYQQADQSLTLTKEWMPHGTVLNITA